MGTTKKIFRWLGRIFSLLLIGYISFYLIFDLVSPNNTVKRLGYKSYTVLTGSMDPVIGVGDLVVVTAHKFEDLKEGDIVTFVDPNKKIVTHHFVRYQEITYRNTKGEVINEIVIRTRPETNQDGKPNLSVDEEGNVHISEDYWMINEYNYIGKYAYKIPKAGKVLLFFQSWIGILTIVLFIAFLYVLNIIIKQVKENKRKEITSEEEKK